MSADKAKLLEKSWTKCDWFPNHVPCQLAIENKQELPQRVLDKLTKSETAFTKSIVEAGKLFEDLNGINGGSMAQNSLKTHLQSRCEQVSVFEDMESFIKEKRKGDCLFRCGTKVA